MRDEYLKEYPNEDWQKNFVMLSTWNEYGEGTYIMPTSDEKGFGYVDIIRELYTDEKASDSVNTVPTAEQLVRITVCIRNTAGFFVRRAIILCR